MKQARQITDFSLSEKLKGLTGLFGIRFGEEPRYQVLVSGNQKEVRRYGEQTLASVSVAGDYERAAEEAFSRLADYLHREPMPTVPLINMEQGSGDSQEAISMTVPVYQQRSRHGWTLSFVLPQRFSLETAPRAQDPGITIERLSGRLVACLRFNGLVNERIIDENTAELRAWLDTNQAFRAAGEPLCALYDNPYTIPFLRRNEIHIPVAIKH